MLWMLLIIVTTNEGSVAIERTPFPTRESCEAAQVALESPGKGEARDGLRVQTWCLETSARAGLDTRE